MVVLLEGSPISTEELWSLVRVTIGFLVTSLTKALLPRLLSLVVPSFFHLRMMLKKKIGTLVSMHRIVHRHNPVSALYGKFLRSHGLVFALTCTVNCGTLYRQVCAFTNHVQSIEFTTGGLETSQGRWTGCTLSFNFRSHCKRVWILM